MHRYAFHLGCGHEQTGPRIRACVGTRIKHNVHRRRQDLDPVPFPLIREETKGDTGPGTRNSLGPGHLHVVSFPHNPCGCLIAARIRRCRSSLADVQGQLIGPRIQRGQTLCQRARRALPEPIRARNLRITGNPRGARLARSVTDQIGHRALGQWRIQDAPIRDHRFRCGNGRRHNTSRPFEGLSAPILRRGRLLTPMHEPPARLVFDEVRVSPVELRREVEQVDRRAHARGRQPIDVLREGQHGGIVAVLERKVEGIARDEVLQLGNVVPDELVREVVARRNFAAKFELRLVARSVADRSVVDPFHGAHVRGPLLGRVDQNHVLPHGCHIHPEAKLDRSFRDEGQTPGSRKGFFVAEQVRVVGPTHDGIHVHRLSVDEVLKRNPCSRLVRLEPGLFQTRRRVDEVIDVSAERPGGVLCLGDLPHRGTDDVQSLLFETFLRRLQAGGNRQQRLCQPLLRCLKGRGPHSRFRGSRW